MNPELTGASKPAPKKKSNAGIIVAIIVAALVIAGGAVAAILIINNANNNGGNEGDTTVAEDISEPYKNDDAYFIKIDGKAFNNQSKLSALSKVGYEVSNSVKDKDVPAGKYMIMIGGGSLTNQDKGTSFSITPYNDGDEKVSFPEAKLGKVTITSTSIESKQKIYEKMEVYGGIHLGSTRKEVEKAFGEPTSEREYDNYKGGKYQKLEYKDKTWKLYEFNIEDGKVTEISWTNYGKLNR